ncbi:MAG: hypothetical protein KJ941_10070 [Bacteroidetes bacterium]|nr:hypothetical protein [Bacteroidota bacterium]
MRTFIRNIQCLTVIFFTVFAVNTGYCQSSEDFIPRTAVSVFSINNIQILQKVSLDELIQYEFMAEIQQELFDGSTAGRSLKDSGFDFDQKLNIFFGKGEEFEVAGFTFGIKDIDALFSVFDDFEEEKSSMEGVRYFRSYFNHLLVADKIGILIRVDPVEKLVKGETDSIWLSRGNKFVPNIFLDEYPETEYEDEEYYDDEEMEDTDDLFNVESEIDQIENGEGDQLIDFNEDLQLKSYNELRDSVFAKMQQKFFQEICVDLFILRKNLKDEDTDLKDLMKHDSEGVFYFDNSRNVVQGTNFSYFRSMFPTLHKDLKELYKGNKIVGDLYLKDDAISAEITAKYGQALGKVYQKMNDSKFDKTITKYIHQESPAYFSYNVNLREAYEEAYKILIPVLKEQKNSRIATNVLAVELINEFINKDAIFDTYKGSMFGTYNGVKKVTVKKLEFNYDEDFNYDEKEVSYLEDMPIFTLGFSTERNDIPEKVLRQIANMTSECKKMGDYWIFENAIFNSVPLYMINKNNLFIFTNDEDLALNHSDGFGSEKLARKQVKEMKKSGFVYANIDWSKMLKTIPVEILETKQADIISALSGQSGNMILTSSKTSQQKTDFKIDYMFEGDYQNSSKYVLDLINSLYIVLH